MQRATSSSHCYYFKEVLLQDCPRNVDPECRGQSEAVRGVRRALRQGPGAHPCLLVRVGHV